MAYDSDILIAGGGLNGPTLALALAQAGLTVTIVDALPRAVRADNRFDGRAYALAAASVNLLRALGVWDRVAEDAQDMREIRVSDGRAGEGAAPWWMGFDSAESDDGPMGAMLEDRYLRQALMDAMDAAGITHIAGQTVVDQAIDADAARITLSDGQVLSGRVLVGCDGRASGVARRAGIQRAGWDYRQTALVTSIAHERPHHGIAHQFFMPAGPLAILPLPGNRSQIVWSEKRGLAERINALPEDDYLAALRPRFGDFLGEIELAGDRFAYPLTLTLATRLVDARLALVGDAAHGMHPIAGQGLNLGLRDVASLAEVLADAHRRGEDIASPLVLDRYARWRHFDIASLCGATDVVNKLFSNDNPVLRLGRDIGMGVIGSLPPLRRAFVREAAGLTGDRPRLLRGLAV